MWNNFLWELPEFFQALVLRDIVMPRDVDFVCSYFFDIDTVDTVDAFDTMDTCFNRTYKVMMLVGMTKV